MSERALLEQPLEKSVVRMILLQEMQAFLECLLQTTNDAVSIIDKEGNVIYWNSAAEKTYGIDSKEIIGKKIGDFFQRESIMLFQVMEGGRPVRQVYHEPRPGMHVMINAAPVLSADHTLIGAISIERDVTQYVKLSAEMYSNPGEQELSPEVFSFKPEDWKHLTAAGRMATPLLLMGEPGVGKKSLAEWLHRHNECEGNFVSVSCSAVPNGLLEAELFGYNGDGERAGKLDLAQQGSIYLKDIHVLPKRLQEKLATAMHEGRYYRSGGSAPVPLQCRIVASVAEEAAGEQHAGLAQELYYSFQIQHLFPLRERKQDLPELCRLFLAAASEKAGIPVPVLGSDALAALTAFDWPGNLPQLSNAMAYAVIAAQDKGEITARELPDYARLMTLTDLTQPKLPLSAHSEEMERALICETLQRTKGNKAKAARQLGISRGALYYKMKQYGLDS